MIVTLMLNRHFHYSKNKINSYHLSVQFLYILEIAELEEVCSLSFSHTTTKQYWNIKYTGKEVMPTVPYPELFWSRYTSLGSQTLKSVKTNSTALVPKCALSVLFWFSYTQLKFASHKHFFLFHFAFVVYATHVSYLSLFTLLRLHTSHKTISQWATHLKLISMKRGGQGGGGEGVIF